MAQSGLLEGKTGYNHSWMLLAFFNGTRINTDCTDFMAQVNSPKQLAKLIAYILERRPDEFGLVPDRNGFIKIRELIKALHEEGGWNFVRSSHLDEILLTLADAPFEIADNAIRAKHRVHLPEHILAADPPKLLFTCVRRKAYPYVKDKGIFPSAYARIILSSRRDLAERMGRRSDHSPVLLTIQVQHSKDKGVVFYQAGESLFAADFIPPDCFTGPPLPKEKPTTKKADEPEKISEQKLAGSYFIDLDEKSNAKIPAGGREKSQASWKTEKKGAKRQKPKRERPPWRR